MENLEQFRAMLLELYENRRQELGVRRLSDTDFAEWLGVNSASYNMWINGRRRPDLASAVVLSRRLGDRVYDVLGYDRVYEITDPGLKTVIEHWSELDAGTQSDIIEILGARKLVVAPMARVDAWR